MTDLLRAELLQTPRALIGRQVEVHDELDSTNSRGLALADDSRYHGLVVFAEKQSAGRGRLQRPWQSPKGASLLCTVVLQLDPQSRVAEGLWLWSALAVQQAVRTACALNSEIKWPNDLLCRGRKLCGILIESRSLVDGRRGYAVGIGLNCLQQEAHFPPELRSRATSLELECHQPIDRLQVAQKLLEALEMWRQQADLLDGEELKSCWLEHAQPLGRRLTLLSEGVNYSGSLIDLDPQAGLLVQLDNGGRRLFAPHTTTLLDQVE
ncbi:MAG: Bifunctional ligase/repressor BirA [Phycisphaerae bacterium]|nr:Bifunctional ligase/repressor BirA [Phycisphaerae bacterium]